MPVASARMLSEISGRHHDRTPGAQPAATWPTPCEHLAEVDDLLKRAIQCGAVVDPWNILGFQGQFSLFPGHGEQRPRSSRRRVDPPGRADAGSVRSHDRGSRRRGRPADRSPRRERPRGACPVVGRLRHARRLGRRQRFGARVGRGRRSAARGAGRLAAGWLGRGGHSPSGANTSRASNRHAPTRS